MFQIFKKKSKEDKLYDKYESLLKESHKLSTSSRIESEKKYAAAQETLREIENLKN